MRRKTLPIQQRYTFTIFTKSKRCTKETIKATVFLYKAIFIIKYTLFV